ncbi:MAG: TonB-dependent receptor [Bacteroidia bacterium]|nr:TonB-dependent receptor [Bacteroidia bacterium]
MSFLRQLLTVIFLSAGTVYSQSNIIISGYVKDIANGEALGGATVFIEELNVSNQSNSYGFYSLSMPAGTYNITVSYTGFEDTKGVYTFKENTTVNFELSKNVITLEGVVIKAKRKDNQVEKVEMSSNSLGIGAIKKIPALLGEVDIVRSVQLLPGVSTVGEGASGFNVRGGGIDQNLILLDEAPVFNSSHLFGFFSIFNPDAVRDVKLLKGGIPANYGGRLSSTLDVKMKEGNNKKFQGTGGIGLIFSRLAFEGPIIKNKASFIVAARRSYIDVLAKPFLTKNKNLKDAKFNFYDLTAKVNYIIDSRNKVFISAYSGRDVFGAPGAQFDWGNTTATLRWNHLFNRKIFANTSAYYSRFDYKLGFGTGNSTFKWISNISNYSIKQDYTYYLNQKNTLTFGFLSTYYNFWPGRATFTDQDRSNSFGLPNKYAWENALYAENEQKVSKKLTVRYGLRFSSFSNVGKGTYYGYRFDEPGQRGTVTDTFNYKSGEFFKTYFNPEPRFSANYKLNEKSSVKLSYNRMAQYLHLISNTAASVPLDVWTPSTPNIKPQLADQIAVGYFKNFGTNQDYEISTEVYYKDMQHQIDYVNAANLLLNENLEGELLSGRGRAYGLELFIKKNTGKITGWISYTLAKSERKVNGISNNEWYANRYDRRHNLNIIASYELNSKVSFAANFVFASGTPTNLPNTKYSFQGIQGIPQNASGLRNNVRIKPYDRLDISATIQCKKRTKFEAEWVFGVYNVYNRRNAFSLYGRNDPNNQYVSQIIKYSVVGHFIPSATYNFKF